MQKKYLSTFMFVGGLGLFTACPPTTGETTDTDAGSTSGSTSDTSNPTSTTNSTTPTTTNPTTTDPTATTTDPTATSGSTTDATSGSTSDGSTGNTTGVMPLTLCDKLGGEAGIGDLVNGAFGAILADDKVNGYFLNSDVDAGNLGSCLNKQLGELAMCPGVVYDCQTMKDAHAGLGISTNDFMDFAVDFSGALDAHQANHPDLADADKQAIMDALAGMAPDIVEDADSNLTVYQRVGRKPAIKTLVGKPAEAGSFVDNVANDAAINGFFGATDFDRLNTCLTRQVSSIDGPIKYAMEVDAPMGVDPGVGVGNECKDMATAHTGLVDANDMIGIDINDFGALVMDLQAAMNTAMVDPADQDAILAVLGPMCEDILAPEFKNQCPTANKLETVEATMINGAIPDDGYNGQAMAPSMFCQDLVVPDDPINFVESVELTAGINHTWLADVVIKLVHPGGKILTLANRPTYAEATDDGVGCCGKGPNLSAMFPLLFKNGGMYDAETMGNTLTSAQTVCKDENPKLNACEFKPNPGKGPGKDFSDFLGENAGGTWKLCVGDSNKADVGTVDSVKLVIKRVKYDPTP